LAILKRFEFSSQLQRMSVIVRNLKDNSLKAFVKGSPEKIKEL
jgi:magnesium-transporting ATPase (P-type)